jgi:hypothetical protein
MEFSVLWAVDRARGVDWPLVIGGLLVALTTALLGVLLDKEGRR